MRFTSHIATLLLPLAVYAAPLESVEERALLDPVLCLVNNLLVGLRNDPLATPYCSSVLGIRPVTASGSVGVTVTPTVTSTVNIGGATATITVGRTSTSGVTTTVTTGVTSTSTIRRATATTTLSCLDVAYTAPVAKRDANHQPEALDKRQAVSVSVGATPTVIPPNANPSQISSVCSCLGLTTNTITVEPTVTAGVTVTSLVTANIQATASVTVTLNQIITSTVTSTVTTTTTTTTTQGVQATALSSSQGLAIAKYTHNFNAFAQTDVYNVAYFRSTTPDFKGFHPSPQIGTSGYPYGTSMTMGSQTFDGSFAAVLFHGFYVARTAGTHTFSSSGDSIDNWGDFWHGDVAYKDYDDENQSFIARRVDGSPYTGGQFSVPMNAGDAIPITWLWANGGGAGQSDLTVTTPSGQRSSGQGNYVPACSADTFA